MAEGRRSIHGQWSSRWAFILAATGSAVGLGNIWRFPYVTGENGGGAFVLVYLICVAVIGLPIMMSEVLLGRRGRQSPVNTMRSLAEDEGRSSAWQALGWMGMLAGFLILSFYSVVAGWTLAYVFRTAAGAFQGATADGISAMFDRFVANPEALLAWHTIFMVMTTIVVSRGVKSGLEKAVRFLMPALFVLLVGMVGFAMGNGAFSQAVDYLFRPNFAALTPAAVLAAMGQAFFSLSLGMGAIMIYGSYLSEHASIVRTTLIIAVMDTLVAVLAGLAIFPLVFQFGLTPDQGPGLIFKILPIAFGAMPGGALVGTLFFVLLVFAGWTSAISLLEPIVTWLVENRGMNRVHAAAMAGMVAWFFGIGSLLSLNLLSESKLWGKTFFDMTEFLSTSIMLPLGGLLIAVFAGWRMASASTEQELELAGHWGYVVWRFLVRYVTPVGVGIVLLNVTGALSWLTG